MKKLLTLSIFSLLLFSCTENNRVKNWGGTGTINIPRGEKLVNVTWKGEQIWYLTTKMIESDTPKTYQFNEESSWGIMEGSYYIVESK